MRIKVRYFSVIRDLVGKRGEELELERGKSLRDLLESLMEAYPNLREYAEGEESLIVLVNGEAAPLDATLEEGCEVALLPPVSGGSRCQIVDGIEEVDRIGKFLAGASEGEGAVLIFLGRVKGVVDGASVEKLIYDVYEPYATRRLSAIAREAEERYNLSRLEVFHAKGSRRVGEATLLIMASASSRKAVFGAVREVLERVKSEVPIWKLEVREDGEFWVVGDGRRIPRRPRSCGR